MELLLNRYRNLTVLVVAILSQLVLLAYQVKSSQDVRLIRVWAVTAVTPLARVIEGVRSSTTRFFSDYFVLLDVRDENRRLKADLNRIKLENQYLKTELSTADRARALAAFQTRSPSKTIAARVIGNGTASTAKVVIVDLGSTRGVQAGMAVITPDGIVGRIIKVYPTASYVLLVSDPTFAAGVISQKNRVRGTLKGQGHSTCIVDYVQNEEKVEEGEWFYTSGDDRVFPKGLPVGQATVVRPGKNRKDIFVAPSGFQNGFEEVLIVMEGVHAEIPDLLAAKPGIHLLPPPPAARGVATAAPAATPTTPLATDADRLIDRYRKIGESQNHKFGEGLPGSKPPDFNASPDGKPVEPPKAGQTEPPKAGQAEPPKARQAEPPKPGQPGGPVETPKPRPQSQ